VARPKLIESWDWTYLEREGLLINELADGMREADETLVEGHELPGVGQASAEPPAY
jgi:hypothetical protein